MKKNKNLFQSFRNAINGFVSFLKNEANAKYDLLALIVTLCLNFIFSVSRIEWIVTCICVGIVISLEMINTAIELLCNLIDENHNNKIKLIKDLSAAAVMLVSFISLIIASLIYIPKIKNYFV